MKICIVKNENGEVYSVHSSEFYNEKKIDDERIIEVSKKENENAGYEKYVNINIPENLEEVFRFLLGEEKYKTQKSLRTVCSQLKDIKESLESIQTDVFDTESFLEDTLRKIEKINEDENDE